MLVSAFIAKLFFVSVESLNTRSVCQSSFLVLVQVKGSCNNLVKMAMMPFSGSARGVPKSPPTQRALDWWESARFQAFFVA